MKIIGLTGGIASGKSTVSSIIRKMGIPVICADELARQVVSPKQLAYKKIVREFGPEILNVNRLINRIKLGTVIFSNNSKRKKLEGIVHPEVSRKIKKEIIRLQNKRVKFVVLDVPLLFEQGLEKMCDKVIVVYAPKAVMIKRLKKRDHLSNQEIKNRLASQWPIKEKKKQADIVIDNSGSREKTKRQVTVVSHKFL